MAATNIRDFIGDPKKVDEDLQSFRRTAKRLSSRHPRLIERYSKQWIALHSGKVQAHGRSFKAVLDQIDSKGLPRGQTIIRFIHKEPRTMIL